jgi:hypothetical protein
MSKVTVPERGQPLDVAYIYELSLAINEISDKISSATTNYSRIDTTSAGPQNIKTSETRILGGYYTVASNSTVSASSTKPFTYVFPDFKYTPIVTASPVNVGKTSAGENVSIVLTDVTRGSVTGLVKFNSSGNVSIVVNLIIIGIPN